MRSIMLAPAFATLALLDTGCDSPPVRWDEPAAIAAAPSAARLAIDSAGRVSFVGLSAPVHASITPAFAGLCSSSFVSVQGTTHRYGVWWSVRPDSSAVLYSAASPDSGRRWSTPVAIDTADVSSRGCDRPPPSPTTVDDDLYVAYSMAAYDGTGIFFAHFMGGMLHSPVAVLYGDHLVETAIAADGQHVAVAYENPNGTRPQVEVGYSDTQGHLFNWRVLASRDIDAASGPVVALRGNRLAVAWQEQKFAGGPPSGIVRVGEIQ